MKCLKLTKFTFFHVNYFPHTFDSIVKRFDPPKPKVKTSKTPKLTKIDQNLPKKRRRPLKSSKETLPEVLKHFNIKKYTKKKEKNLWLKNFKKIFWRCKKKIFFKFFPNFCIDRGLQLWEFPFMKWLKLTKFTFLHVNYFPHPPDSIVQIFDPPQAKDKVTKMLKNG